MTKSLTSHNEWRYVLRDFLRSSQGRSLANFPSDALSYALAPVAAISLWIDEYAPALKEKPALDIVIAGAAHGMDTLDEGRWYRFLPLFLGNADMNVTVDLVGKGLDATVPEVFSGSAFPLEPKKSTMAAKVTHLEAPRRFPNTLGEYMASRANRPAPDLVFIFHPGFILNSNSWIAEGDLRSVLALGTPVGLASYGEEEHMQEVWVLAAHGYKADPKVVKNRFAANLHKQVLPSAFAHTLWKLDNALPATDAPISEENLDKIKAFDKWMYEAAQKGVILPFLKAFGGTTQTKHGDFIILPNLKLVEKTTGKVYEPSNAEKFNPVGVTIEKALLDAYPENSPFDFDRAYWSINVVPLVEQSLDNAGKNDGVV
ncbi:MAG: hypothetical protein C4516_09995 [Oxalobacter sp.]|nr:MAG: hypothetical protein C4516_09995 [Oxalobacter sp.]